MECVESVLQSLDPRLILFKKNSRKHIDIKRITKEEMEGVENENVTSAFIEKWTQRVSGYS